MFGLIKNILGLFIPSLVNTISCGSVKKFKEHTDEFVDEAVSDKRIAAASLRSIIYSIIGATSIFWILVFIIVVKEEAWNRVIDLVNMITGCS